MRVLREGERCIVDGQTNLGLGRFLISILNFFPPNRGVDFYFEFLPAKLTSTPTH